MPEFAGCSRTQEQPCRIVYEEAILRMDEERTLCFVIKGDGSTDMLPVGKLWIAGGPMTRGLLMTSLLITRNTV